MSICMGFVPPEVLDKIDPTGEQGRHWHRKRSKRDEERRAGDQLTASATSGKVHRSIYTLDGQPSSAGLPSRLIRDEDDDRVQGNDNANEAHYYIGRCYTFAKEVFGRDSLDGRGGVIQVTVNAGGVDGNNAFYDNRGLVFGDGDERIFTSFTNDPDVMWHEFGHSISVLRYFGQSGALNESCSDWFGSMGNQWLLNQTVDQADWLIGNTLMVQGPGTNYALRSMKAPGTAYVDHPILGTDLQPRHMRDYNQSPVDNQQVHTNSGIINHWFYLFAMAVGGFSWEKPGQVAYQTVTRLSPNAQFADAASLSNSIAETEGVGDECRQAWEAVGL